jgi:hypothetical protein
MTNRRSPSVSRRLNLEPLELRLPLSATAVLPLNILGMQQAGQAAFSGTQTDIGSVSQIFDGQTQTLMRTANIDPAFVDLSFASPQTLRGFRVFTSQPEHRWKVQSADTLADLNNQTGSYAEIVSWTSTPGGQYSSVTLPAPDTASYVRLTVERLAGDNFVHIYEWEITGDVTLQSLDVTPPVLELEATDTAQLAAKGIAAGGVQYAVNNLVAWGSSNPAAATVDTGGMVTALAAGQTQVTATLQDLQDASQVTVTSFEPEPIDLDVTYIARTPRYNYDAAKNNPASGDSVTFEAHVRNWGDDAVASAAYRWEIDGSVASQGTLADFLGRSERTVSLPWTWQTGAHTVKFIVDPLGAVAETSEVNNAIENRTDGISVGFWVEQSLYEYFQEKQRFLGIGSNSWENWAQRQMNVWNQDAAAAVSSEAPLGAVDRVRIDKIVVVPDGALPLNGGLPTNNPNLADRTVDMMWGFPSSLLNGDFYANTTGAVEGNAFYLEPSLVHELGHARYLVDNYGFDVHNTAGHASVQILENGQPVAGSPLMPFLAFGEMLYANRYGGRMGGPYPGWSPHETGALNRIAGLRASQGNYNAPGNIGVYLDNLPASNRVSLVDESGVPAAGAQIQVFRTVATPGLYAKTFDTTPDAQYVADANGEFVLPRNPFRPGSAIRSPEQGIVVLRVELAGKVWYRFLEVAQFNLEYWRGHVAEGRYTIELPGPGNSRVAQDIAVDGLDKPITRGSATPSVLNGTDFDARPQGAASLPNLFTIKNEGATLLNLTGPNRVSISGPHAADFAVVGQQPAQAVGPGGLTTLQLAFTPHGVGVRTATVTISSNDPEEPLFTFTVTGRGLLTGDYNADNVVDGADFLTWQRTLGSVAIPSGVGADGGNNGRVDGADLGLWKSNFGASASLTAGVVAIESSALQRGVRGTAEQVTDEAFAWIAFQPEDRGERETFSPAPRLAYGEANLANPPKASTAFLTDAAANDNPVRRRGYRAMGRDDTAANFDAALTLEAPNSDDSALLAAR